MRDNKPDTSRVVLDDWKACGGAEYPLRWKGTILTGYKLVYDPNYRK
jgi:hypothetical protein